MKTTSRVEAEGFLRAPFAWYGLDEAFTGPRRLMPGRLTGACGR